MEERCDYCYSSIEECDCELCEDCGANIDYEICNCDEIDEEFICDGDCEDCDC